MNSHLVMAEVGLMGEGVVCSQGSMRLPHLAHCTQLPEASDPRIANLAR
jgi:hypothetical protein